MLMFLHKIQVKVVNYKFIKSKIQKKFFQLKKYKKLIYKTTFRKMILLRK